ncbi:reverse transcriptase domain-containing protein [Tanacetum coccineum]
MSSEQHSNDLDQLLDSALDDFQTLNLASTSSQRLGTFYNQRPVDEIFYDIYDRYEPCNEPSLDNCFISTSYDATTHFESTVSDVLNIPLPAVMEFIRNHLISSIILVMISSVASLTFNLPNIGTKNQNREIFTQGVWASISNSGIQVTPDEIGSPITPPAILTPSQVLPPSLLFDPRYFFVPEELLPPKERTCLPSLSSTNPSQNQTCNLVTPSFSVYTPTPPQIFKIGKSSIKMHLKHHEEHIEDILNYLDELSFHRIEKMEEGRINDRMIIQRNGNELKTELKRIRTQIIKLHKKQLGQKDKIAFAHYRISNLEQIIEEIQALKRQVVYTKESRFVPYFQLISLSSSSPSFASLSPMPPKRTSTSETPAITLAAIQQLITDGITAALEAQAATMANADNPNRNTGPREIHVAKRGN